MIAVTKRQRLEDDSEILYPKYLEQCSKIKVTVLDKTDEFIFNGYEDSSIEVYYISTKDKEEVPISFTPHYNYGKVDKSPITCLKIDPKNHFLFVGFESGSIKIFDISDMSNLSNVVICETVIEDQNYDPTDKNE